MQSKQVYLFGTCLIDSFYPESGMDAIALLELCNYQIVFPQAQTCCGQPPYNSGEASPAKDVAWHTIQVFSDKKLPVIVPSASCAAMIKHHYPTLFDTGSTEHKQAIELSSRTYELIEFLEPILPYNKQIDSSHTHISLHRSCSALREMEVAEPWLSILRKLDGVEVSLPTLEQECCGFGGTFAIKSPEISAAMTADKCEHLLSPNTQSILSGDCGCILNISGHIKHSGDKRPCTHIARFIAQRFGIQHD